MEKIILEQDEVIYIVEIEKKYHTRFGTNKIFAVLNYNTGNLIFNLDYSEEYPSKIIISNE